MGALSDDELRRLYLSERRRPADIARRHRLKPLHVTARLAALGILRTGGPHKAQAIDTDHVVRMYRDEWRCVHDIASQLGTSEATVLARLRNAGVARRAANPPAEVVRRLYLDDQLGAAAIADRLGIGRKRAARLVRTGGLPPTRGTGNHDEQANDLYDIYGLTVATIAELLGSNRGAVAKAIRRAGRRPVAVDSAVPATRDRTILRRLLRESGDPAALAARLGVDVGRLEGHARRIGATGPSHPTRTLSDVNRGRR
ncbi:MAG TPA: hypothetical protein VHD87_12900 [Acidimicrobiales bacterium]|nr:hypothetical protein [Acidimicrobiales bacterium]